MNNTWCTNTTVKVVHFCPDIEYTMVQHRPFYLQRKLTAVTIIAVYVLPQANAKLAMELFQRSINKQLTTHLNYAVIVAILTMKT